MIYYSPEFDISALLGEIEPLPHRRGVRAKGDKRKYLRWLSAFDIETTNIREIKQAVMYVWQWHFMALDGKTNETIIGRTWDQYEELCLKIAQYIGNDERPEDQKIFLVRLVHNLSFEFQFISGIYDYTENDVFCIEPRKILRADCYGCIEDRCTYLHSNTSLAQYGKMWGIEHRKLSGDEYDYSKYRFWFTPLSEMEMQYAINDVWGLCEAYRNEMRFWNDDLYTIPMTSTGYCRRDAKAAWGTQKYGERVEIQPNMELFTLLSFAFRGGNTHASRFYVGKEGQPPIIVKNVFSYDRASSYPDVMCNCKFPMSKFRRYAELMIDADKMCYLTKKLKKAILCVAHFEGLRLKSKFWPCPYLSFDKLLNRKSLQNQQRIIDRENKNLPDDEKIPRVYLLDNGRVLKCKWADYAITDIDWEIIQQEYTWDSVVFTDVYYSTYRKLPDAYISLVQEYFRRKTELKNTWGEGAAYDASKEIEYNLQKNLINALYGMMCQRPVKDSILYKDGDYKYAGKDKQELLDKNNKRGFMPYQLGVWVTAWARYWLERAIRLIVDTPGAEFLYTDTDSVKFTGNVNFNSLNKEIQKASEKSKSRAIDTHGKIHYMGVYEQETSYAEFSTMGAKKYIYKYEGSDEIHVTIAGVDKKKGGPELMKHGGMKAFKSGFTFRDAGGLDVIYNDKPEIDHIEVDGHIVPITKNVYLEQGEYTLGLSQDYARLIDAILAGRLDFETIL